MWDWLWLLLTDWMIPRNWRNVTRPSGTSRGSSCLDLALFLSYRAFPHPVFTSKERKSTIKSVYLRVIIKRHIIEKKKGMKIIQNFQARRIGNDKTATSSSQRHHRTTAIKKHKEWTPTSPYLLAKNPNRRTGVLHLAGNIRKKEKEAGLSPSKIRESSA